jgi:hypothetical protein
MSKGQRNIYVPGSHNIPEYGVIQTSRWSSKTWSGDNDPIDRNECKYGMTGESGESSGWLVDLEGHPYGVVQAGPLGVTPDMPQLGDLHGKCISDLIEQYNRHSSDFSASVAEIDESAKMLVSAGKSLLSGHFWRDASFYAMNPHHAYIANKFGIQPLMNDVRSGIQAIRAACDSVPYGFQKLVSRKYAFNEDTNDPLRKYKSEVSCCMRVTLKKNAYTSPPAYDFTPNVPAIIWERTGWSWAADYFTNVGLFLNGAGAVAQLSNISASPIWVSDKSISSFEALSAQVLKDGFTWDFSLLSPSKTKLTTLSRYPLDQSLTGLAILFELNSLHNFKNLTQASTIAAALSTRFRF